MGMGMGRATRLPREGRSLTAWPQSAHRGELRSRTLHWEAWQLHPAPTPTESRKNVSEGERQGGWLGGGGSGERERERKTGRETVYTAHARAPGCLCEYMCTVEIFILLDICPEEKHICMTALDITLLFYKS